MNKEKISRIIGRIDGKYIDEATGFGTDGCEYGGGLTESGSTPERPIRRIRPVLLAALIAALILVGSGVTALAVESGEYRSAVSFFEENGLSTEGLSRSEIKVVYRDIITKSFTNGKTAEVLKQAVPGWEIEQEAPTPGELAAIWDKNVWMNTVAQNGVKYRVDSRYVIDEKSGMNVFEKDVLECYRDGKLLWSAEFRDFYVVDQARIKENTVVWGNDMTNKSYDLSFGWIALVDGTGNVIWQKLLDHGFQREYVASVLNNGDGTLAVITRGDIKYLGLSCYDLDGKELGFRKTEVGNFGIRNAARLGDGYIVQLWNQYSGDTALIYKMDREGNLTDSFSYEADDCDYYITDMVEYEGQVYLSAYAVPKQRDEGGRHEIADLLHYLFSKGNGAWDISSEELTPIVRDNYTAMLLMCDPEGGAPKTFYSVKGSLGGALAVNDDDILEWNVESITATFYSPLTSSFTIGGTCTVFRYSFDASGSLIGQTDTGETVRYAR
jgi:hypothetical protein